MPCFVQIQNTGIETKPKVKDKRNHVLPAPVKILVIHFKRQSPAWFVFGIALKLLSRLFDSLFTNSFKQLPLLLPQLFTYDAYPCHRLGETPRGNKSQHTICGSILEMLSVCPQCGGNWWARLWGLRSPYAASAHC